MFTMVPTGPELGDSVTVGVVRVKIVDPVLPWASVSVKAEPKVILGKQTVPVYEPVVELIELLLNVVVDVVDVYAVSAFREVKVITTVTVIEFAVPTSNAATVPENVPEPVPVGVAIVGVKVPDKLPAANQRPPAGVIVAPAVMVTTLATVTTVAGTTNCTVPAEIVAVPVLATFAKAKLTVGWNGGIIVPAKVACVIAFVKPA